MKADRSQWEVTADIAKCQQSQRADRGHDSDSSQDKVTSVKESYWLLVIG